MSPLKDNYTLDLVDWDMMVEKVMHASNVGLTWPSYVLHPLGP